MAFINNTMFEVKVSNSVNNQTQHVAGYFGTGTGENFTNADCSAGMLCVRNGLTPCEGYEEVTPAILNGNTWYMNVATNGESALAGDHTGIYAFNNYDVNKATSGDNAWNIGAKTLGLGLPTGERGDFCEIIIHEQYKFGAGNFSTAPTEGAIYATISNGLLVASSTAPSAGAGLYFKLLRTQPINEGSAFVGTGYIVEALRA